MASIEGIFRHSSYYSSINGQSIRGRLYDDQFFIIGKLELYSFEEISTKLYEDEHWTLLMFAVFYKFPKVVEYLLDRGVDTSFKSDIKYDYDYKEYTAFSLIGKNEEYFSSKTLVRLIPNFWRMCKIEYLRFIVFPLPRERYIGCDNIFHLLKQRYDDYDNSFDYDEERWIFTTHHRDIITTMLLCGERLDCLPTELILFILSKLAYYQFYKNYRLFS